MKTLRDACTELRVTYKTLEKWIERLEIEPRQHPRDFRFRVIEDEDVERIHIARSEMPGVTLTRVTVTRTPVALSGVPILSPSPQAQQSDFVPSATKPLRQAERGMIARLEPLPEDWIAFNTGFCKGHGELDGRSIERDPLFPRPHDRGPQRVNWWRGHGAYPQGIRSAYDQEQHLQAARLAAERWPQRFRPCHLCSSVVERSES